VDNDVTPTRRHVVTAGAAATLGIATAAALTACSGSSGSSGSGASGASGGSSAAGTGSGSGTSASGPAGATGTSGTGAAGGVPTTVTPPALDGSGADKASRPLAKLSAIPVGGAIAAKATDGTPIVVTQPEAGKVKAFSAICTHMGCTVRPAGKKLICACHNSTFNPATGEVTGGPAPSPLPVVTVKVDGGNVVAG
jgi:Rieske Fe-S protein